MRGGPQRIGTAGAVAGNFLGYNPVTDEYEPRTPPGGLTGLTSHDSSVTISDNHDGTLDLSASGGSGGAAWGKPYPLDLPPTVANARDDEFDGTSVAVWVATPSAATSTLVNPTNAPSMLEILQSGSANFQGLLQAVPGSYPYTITACLAYTDMLGTNDRGGMLILGPTGPIATSQAIIIGRAAQVGFAGGFQFNGTFTNVVNPQVPSFNRLYLRIRVNSATSVDSWFNEDGSGWVQRHSAVNPGFTPGVMGLAASRASGTYGSRAYFDWFRVT